ncbi:hypothetical protein Nstercoris_02158 [Nitrosomonas stercoris]|uniref:Transglycosylase SLT domain-containing protein n=1 Tax=Nitrosomonas stercoris TaxID=1444684 RepID=A0A4Y1YRP8_9PROT|nr:hypothetical protein Nstercoris_02158 [Nitrosomonas stercoris]
MGSQVYEILSASTRTVLQRTVSDSAVAASITLSDPDAHEWLNAMVGRLERRIPDLKERKAFLTTVYYEATRAGLDPELVLSIIQIESNFKKYAVSSVGARGYMQVMPFWVDVIGTPEHNLFHLRVNLRYGCTILRHYLDLERGNYFRALGRYNGSLGKADYPNLVFNAWQRHWVYSASAQREIAQKIKVPNTIQGTQDSVDSIAYARQIGEILKLVPQSRISLDLRTCSKSFFW